MNRRNFFINTAISFFIIYAAPIITLAEQTKKKHKYLLVESDGWIVDTYDKFELEKQAFSERDKANSEIDKHFSKIDNAISKIDKANSERDKANSERDKAITERDSTNTVLNALLKSNSWKITEPLRDLASFFK